MERVKVVNMKSLNFLVFILILISSLKVYSEVNPWNCGKFDKAKVIAEDGTFLGELGPSWKTDSIYNSSSKYSSTWFSGSIYNEHNSFGNSYSHQSVFNESASDPPKIIDADGNEIGALSIGPSWNSNRYHPDDIKYTCDWD